MASDPVTVGDVRRMQGRSVIPDGSLTCATCAEPYEHHAWNYDCTPVAKCFKCWTVESNARALAQVF